MNYSAEDLDHDVMTSVQEKVTRANVSSPVPPTGDAHRLDDEDHHLAEKHKEEEEEADGAVCPKRQETFNYKPNVATSSQNFRLVLLPDADNNSADWRSGDS